MIPIPLTSYCKKCGQDVPVSAVCPNCRAKLAASTVRLAWCVEHHPVKDWMCWNAVMRLLLPVLGTAFGLIVLAEGIISGMAGVAAMLSGGLVTTLLILLGLVLSGLLLVFILQGDDLLDCVIDARGIHVQTYLPNPTDIKLLMRGKSPRLLDSGEDILLLSSREIAWKDIARVQLWPEKTMILLYAPRWWMLLALPCTPFTWLDALAFIREKIGRKKAVILPEVCRQMAPKKGTSRKKADVAEETPSIPLPEEEPVAEETAPPEDNAPIEEPPPEDGFTSLEDVLQEIKDAEQA